MLSMKPWRSTRTFLVLLCLSLSAVACSSNLPRVVTPPDALLQDCPEPSGEAYGGLRTIGDTLVYTLAVKAALRACNADKEALRVWAEEVQLGE